MQENYRDIDDIVRMCELRIRVPDQWKGDFLAMVGSARIGERETLELGREIGWEKLTAFAANGSILRRADGGADSGSAGRTRHRLKHARSYFRYAVKMAFALFAAPVDFETRRKDASSSICATTSNALPCGLQPLTEALVRARRR